MYLKHTVEETANDRISIEHLPWEPWWLLPWIVTIHNYDGGNYSTAFRFRWTAKRHVKRIIRYTNK